VPCAVFFLGLSAASLFVLERPPMWSPAFRVPLYPLPLLLFLTMVGVMVALFVGGQPMQTALGALVVIIGLLASRLIV
jgi:hypothetical protein